MSDYDVINYGLAPVPPTSERMDVFCDPPGPTWCGAVNAPHYLYDRLCRIFFSWKETEGEWIPEKEIFHCEDQVFIRRMLDTKQNPCPPWLRRVPGCSLYPDLTGNLVHYTSAAMKESGHWPKHEHIPKLRPIE